MTAQELLRAIAISNTVCRHTGHRLEGRAQQAKSGGWVYTGRCELCGIPAAGHVPPPRH